MVVKFLQRNRTCNGQIATCNGSTYRHMTGHENEINWYAIEM